MTGPGSLPAPDNALVRLSSGEQVALYIRRLIFDGLLRQGDRIPQDAIAAKLGLSRIPVREALLSLEREGWVTIRPHRGAFIGALDEGTIRDHYELYGRFYSFTVIRAAERGAPEQLDRLIELQRQIMAAAGPLTTWRLNCAFHGTVVDMARSQRLRPLLGALSGVVPGNFFELVPGSMDLEKKGSAAIVRALRRGDGDRAAQAYVTMMRGHGERVIALFRERGMFPADSGIRAAG
nr:GntR family transcriptional regulator [Frankia gtarii]